MITTRHVAEHLMARIGKHLSHSGYSSSRVCSFKLANKAVGIKVDIRGFVFTANEKGIWVEWDSVVPKLIPIEMDVSKFRFEWNTTTRLLEITRW